LAANSAFDLFVPAVRLLKTRTERLAVTTGRAPILTSVSDSSLRDHHGQEGDGLLHTAV
jgi:hypothetical protein